MTFKQKPVRSTMAWGFFGGLAYLPLIIALNMVVPWPLSLNLLLWALLAGYGLMLTRWAAKPLTSIAVPLLLLLLATFFIRSTTAFGFAALGMLSWMRSGICFNRTRLVKRLAVETILGIAAGLPVFVAVPTVTLSGALGVWLFFLIQTLYFVLFDYGAEPQHGIEVDAFEQAKMAAEQILAREVF